MFHSSLKEMENWAYGYSEWRFSATVCNRFQILILTKYLIPQGCIDMQLHVCIAKCDNHSTLTSWRLLFCVTEPTGSDSTKRKITYFLAVNLLFRIFFSRYGYRGRDCRNNLYVLSSGELIYFTAAVVVLYDVASHKQRHYTEHTDDIKR